MVPQFESNSTQERRLHCHLLYSKVLKVMKATQETPMSQRDTFLQSQGKQSQLPQEGSTWARKDLGAFSQIFHLDSGLGGHHTARVPHCICLQVTEDLAMGYVQSGLCITSPFLFRS